MILDDCVMIIDRDEFVYHEMISHIPVCFHNDPKTVVVIGGGDGGTVRELVKHKSIEKIILVKSMLELLRQLENTFQCSFWS